MAIGARVKVENSRTLSATDGGKDLRSLSTLQPITQPP